MPLLAYRISPPARTTPLRPAYPMHRSPTKAPGRNIGMTAASDKSAEPTSSGSKPTMLGIAETLESIVVAFILAFVFRAFIVEAFVIPTGSMAVTLYGAQLTQTCSTCGYEYAYGVPSPPTDADGRPVAMPAVRLRCPNCDMQRDGFDSAALANPDSGDRILVFKWPLDIGGQLLGPHRWDVTVFKDPRDGTTNFIKRLVGLPGEVLEIIDGDVYAASVETLQAKEPGLVEALDELRAAVAAHRQSGGGPEPPEIHNRYLELNRRLLPHLQIQRKTDRAQRSLWCIVYDHDFLPNYEASLRQDQLRARVGWWPEGDAAASAWNATARRITFSASAPEPLFIRFDGKPIDDSCAYNNDGIARHVLGGHFPVGDVRLSFGWLPRAGGGGLTLEMNRNRDRFIADLAVDGSAELKWARLDNNGQWSRPELVGRRTGLGPFINGRTSQITLAIVDYRVALAVNDREILATSDDPEHGYRPREPDLDRFIQATVNQQRPEQLITPSQVRIGARDLQCDLLHVRLERDVYYRSQRLTNELGNPNPYDGWPGWGTAGRPILLRKGYWKNGRWYHGEYFMLGDNSPASKDSRLWWEIGDHLKPLGEEYQLGTVPEDQLIGRAFFVYWPAGFRASWAGGIALIPNVGRMRWIR